jgi:CHAD domain-containing protein
VTRGLGTLRELDALIPLLEAIQRDRVHGGGPALALVLDAVRAERRQLHDRQEKAELGRRMARLAKRLEKVAKRLDRTEPRLERRWTWAVDARVARRAAAVQRAIGAAGTVYLPERLHDVRKALKKLRYAIELRYEVEPGSGQSDLQVARRAQELLGALHDRQVVIDRIRAAQASANGLAARQARPQLDVVLSELEDECRRSHGRYLRGCPKLLELSERLVVSGRATTRSGGRPPIDAAVGS